MRTAVLEGQQLLRTEGLVMDLRSSLDKILEMGSEKEVAEVNKFAMVFVLDVDDTPSILATADLLAINHNGLFGANNSKWNETLFHSLDSVVSVQHLAKLTLICPFRERSSSSNSSLSYGYILRLWKENSSLMRSLKAWRSSTVNVSALAMTGTTLTTSDSFFKTTISMGFSEWPEGWMKNKQQ